MNGVHPPNHNRFALLADQPNPKQKKTSSKRIYPDFSDSPPLPISKTNHEHLPRYLIATSVSLEKSIKAKSLASYNTFQVARGLKHICPYFTEVIDMKSGDLLIKANNLKAANKFLSAKYIDNIPVSISIHRGLNCSYGKITCKEIKEFDEETILKEMNDDYPDYVWSVRKIMRKEGNQLVPTASAVITFNDIHPPTRIHIGWRSCVVHEYIPNPLRCKNCQKLGHTKNFCKHIAVCEDCAAPLPHEKCLNKFCVNCNNNTHSSNDSSCPSFLRYKSVNKIKIQHRCSAREAWEKFNQDPEVHLIKANPVKKPTYANIVAGQNNSNKTPPMVNTITPTKTTTTTTSSTTPTFTAEQVSVNDNFTSEQTPITQHEDPSLQQNPTPLNQTQQNLEYKTQQISSENNLEKPSTSQKQYTLQQTSFLKLTSQDNLPSITTQALPNCLNSELPNIEELMEADMEEGLASPLRHKPADDAEDSPCTHLFKKFPQMNTIITPKTYRKTLDPPNSPPS